MKRNVIAIVRYAVAIICIPVLLFSACNSDDAYTAYSRYKANFIYDRVMTTTPLKNALAGPGEFCTIKIVTEKQIVFKSLTMSQNVNIVAADIYKNTKSINWGFIVGLPNSIELGYDYFSPVCFDIVCSNCYKGNIKKDLTLQEGGFAYCSRCERRYNLNNLGIVEGAPAGKPLERYRIDYNGMNHMAIKN